MTGEGRSPGMLTVFCQLFRKEGFRGLYSGLLPNFLKVIPAVSIGYVAYEQFKKMLGVTTVK